MNNTNLSTLFGDIANSIRGKEGSQESIKPEQFPYKITNLPGGKETNVYKIERLKDIHNIKAKEHDIAVLSRTDKSDITDNFTGGKLSFKSTVILNEPIGDEEYIDGMIFTDEGELMISGDKTQVNIDFIGDSQLQILYTSDDGKTYNTQDTIEVIEIKNVHDFHFDNKAKQFIQVYNQVFSVFEYSSINHLRIPVRNSDDIYIKPLKDDGLFDGDGPIFCCNAQVNEPGFLTEAYVILSNTQDTSNIRYYYQNNELHLHYTGVNNSYTVNVYKFENSKSNYITQFTPKNDEDLVILNNCNSVFVFSSGNNTYNIYDALTGNNIIYESTKSELVTDLIWDYMNIGVNIASSDIALGKEVYADTGHIIGTSFDKGPVETIDHIELQDLRINTDITKILDVNYFEENCVNNHTSLESNNTLLMQRADAGYNYYGPTILKDKISDYKVSAYNLICNEWYFGYKPVVIMNNDDILKIIYKYDNIPSQGFRIEFSSINYLPNILIKDKYNSIDYQLNDLSLVSALDINTFYNGYDRLEYLDFSLYNNFKPVSVKLCSYSLKEIKNLDISRLISMMFINNFDNMKYLKDVSFIGTPTINNETVTEFKNIYSGTEEYTPVDIKDLPSLSSNAVNEIISNLYLDLPTLRKFFTKTGTTIRISKYMTQAQYNMLTSGNKQLLVNRGYIIDLQ